MSANMENPAVATGPEKSSSQFPRRAVLKNFQKHWTIALFSHASKVMLKILQARLQHYVNQELPDTQPGFRKGIQLRN